MYCLPNFQKTHLIFKNLTYILRIAPHKKKNFGPPMRVIVSTIVKFMPSGISFTCKPHCNVSTINAQWQRIK